MDFTAPAKINLCLKVLSKREDGYHEIETLFERISLLDRISIELARDATTIICGNPGVPTGKDSLMARTVAAFRKAAGENFNFDIRLDKNIPIGAGLGGGSSDAAVLLKGMNTLAGNPLDRDTLFNISAKLGADVPFFMSDSRFAYGTGRGDIIQRVETSLEICHVLVTPPFEASTKDVYNSISALGLTKNKGVDRMFTAFLNEGNISGLSENLCNDLQVVTLRNFPILKKVSAILEKEGAKGTLVSGSGPTVFGIFDCSKAERAAENIRSVFPAEENWRVFSARTY